MSEEPKPSQPGSRWDRPALEGTAYIFSLPEKWRITAILDGSPLQPERWARVAVWLLDEAEAARKLMAEKKRGYTAEFFQDVIGELEFLAGLAVLRGSLADQATSARGTPGRPTEGYWWARMRGDPEEFIVEVSDICGELQVDAAHWREPESLRLFSAHHDLIAPVAPRK